MYRVLLAASLAAFPTVASAKVVFCNATGRAVPNVRYYTPFVDIGSSDTASLDLGRAFEAYLRTTHPEGDSWDAHCDAEPSLSRSESRLDWFKYNNKDAQWIPTDFTGGFPKATSASRDVDASGPYLTVKKDTGSADAAKALNEAILKAQRDGAAALARRIAETARTKAETQAQLAKFFTELKKRGRAQ